MLPSIRIDSWDDWTRVYNDVSVWRSLVDGICVREGIGYRQLHPASANTNAVFLLDHAYALKIYSPFWDEFDFERTLLEALKDNVEIPVPDVVGHGRITDGGGVTWPYLITRYCDARPFAEIRSELSDADTLSLAAQLGRIVRALHALDASQLASNATERGCGKIAAEGRDLLKIRFWLTGFPGITIVIIALVGNLLGNWMRDYLDPQLRNIQ